MRSNIARKKTASETLNEVRPVVESMIKGEEYTTGSKMLAYENVGRSIGKSASWVRKLLSHGDVALQHFEFLNIVRAYDTLCTRLESAAASERARAEYLRRIADETLERTARVVAGTEGPDLC